MTQNLNQNNNQPTDDANPTLRSHKYKKNGSFSSVKTFDDFSVKNIWDTAQVNAKRVLMEKNGIANKQMSEAL